MGDEPGLLKAMEATAKVLFAWSRKRGKGKR